MLGLGLGISKGGTVPIILPNAIDNLKMWLRNGVSVGVDEWADQSVNGNNASQGDSAHQASVDNGGLLFTAANEDE